MTTEICSRCGRPEDQERLREVPGAEGLFCPYCISICSHCDEPFVWTGESLCPGCQDGYFICPSCGQVRSADDLSEDEYQCQECYQYEQEQEEEEEEENRVIKEYHEYCTPPKLGESEENIYFGVELEAENFRNKQETAEELRNKLDLLEKLFVLSEDCSLIYGFELVTAPATLDYHEETFPWKEITDIESRSKARNTDHAALHIHVGKAFFGANVKSSARKLVWLVDTYYDHWINLTNLNHYLSVRSAKRHSDSVHARIETTLDEFWSAIRYESDRYRAVNLESSQDTIEFRMFPSTNKPETIFAYLELVDFLVRLAKDTRWEDVIKLTWKEIYKKMINSGHKNLIYLVENCPEIKEEENPPEEPKTTMETLYPIPETVIIDLTERDETATSVDVRLLDHPPPIGATLTQEQLETARRLLSYEGSPQEYRYNTLRNTTWSGDNGQNRSD